MSQKGEAHGLELGARSSRLPCAAIAATLHPQVDGYGADKLLDDFVTPRPGALPAAGPCLKQNSNA
jgi:hypothetical protein